MKKKRMKCKRVSNKPSIPKKPSSNVWPEIGSAAAEEAYAEEAVNQLQKKEEEAAAEEEAYAEEAYAEEAMNQLRELLFSDISFRIRR